MQAEVNRVASQINEKYKNTCPLFLVVLNGSFMFAADLFRELTITCDISFIKLASYDGMQSNGVVREILGLNESVSGREVIIVEDIIDSGKTVQTLKQQLREKGAKTIEVVAALFKPAALTTNEEPNYFCFTIENVFVVGYGLDYNGQGRNLKEIHILV